MRASTGAAERRLGVITVDQALSGASNIVVAACAARLLSVESFGLFGVVFLTYVAAQGLVRALICNPLLLHADDARDRPVSVASSLAAVALVLSGCVAVAGVVALRWSPDLGTALLALALGLPVLALQDLGRYLSIARHEPQLAVVLDGAWLLGVVAGVVLLIGTGWASLPSFVAVWVGTGAVSSLIVSRRYGFGRLRPELAWVRSTWSFSVRYFLIFAATQGGALASVGIVGAIAGTRALGALRGVALATSPFSTVQAAAMSAGVAEIVRDPSHLATHVRRTTWVAAVLASLNALGMVLLPDSLGHVLLGDTWDAAKPLLLPAALQIVLLALITGVQTGISGARATGLLTRLNVTAALITLVAATVGVVINGALGLCWALVVEQALVNVLWVLAYLRRARTVADLPGRSRETSS